jgi:hypothetical protein
LRRFRIDGHAHSYEFTLRKFQMFSERLRVAFPGFFAAAKKVALRQWMTNMHLEAIASMLMASVVSTALLKEVRASVSVGGGGRRW